MPTIEVKNVQTEILFLSTIGQVEIEENGFSFYRLRVMLRKSLMNPCLTWCESGQRTRCQEQSSGVCKSWPLTSLTKCMSTLGQNQLTPSLRPYKRKLSDHQKHQVLTQKKLQIQLIGNRKHILSAIYYTKSSVLRAPF